MSQSRRQEREARKRDKQARLVGLARKREVKRVEAVRASFPKFDAIKVLSIGEGAAPGFAHNLARKYLNEGVAGKVVAVDLQPAGYKLPENMAHVTGDAIDFLKTLPPPSRCSGFTTTSPPTSSASALQALRV